MQHIQDKEFDQLFEDKFEGAEIEPSSDLWSNIEQGMLPKRKHTFPVYWMAAAAVIAVLTAGLMLLNQPGKIQLQKPVAVRTQPESAAPIVLPVEKPVQITAITDVKRLVRRNTFAKIKKVLNTAKITAPDTLINFIQKDTKEMQPVTQIARLTIKPDAVKEDNLKPDAGPVITKEEMMMASTAIPVVRDEVSNENDQTDKKGIRNVGDLINYVVDKVDKREEKFIQFNTDNDDNSSLTGINLGMIKFSHKRQK